MAEVIDRARTSQPGLLRRARGVLRRVVNSISRWWRTRTATKALLVAGIVAAGLYVVGDVLSGLIYIYDSSRPYSFKDQWISELTALGSPVRPLMVSVITVHDLLLTAFAVGILRAAGQNRSPSLGRMGLLAATALSIWIHPFFPMTSRWLERSFTGHDARDVDVCGFRSSSSRSGCPPSPTEDGSGSTRSRRWSWRLRDRVRDRHPGARAERHAVGRSFRAHQRLRTHGMVRRAGRDRDAPLPQPWDARKARAGRSAARVQRRVPS